MSNLTIQRGQSVTWTFTLADDGGPVDLTGNTGWEILENGLGTTVTITTTVTDAANGISTFTIDKDDTKDLKATPEGVPKKIRARINLAGGGAIATGDIFVDVK